MIDYETNREKWKLDLWWERVDAVENSIIDIAEEKKTDESIDYVIIRNYGRLSLCLREMLTLLLNGYPDGALAIARSAYEIAIITDFLYSEVEKKGDKQLLKCYLADHNVKVYKSQKQLNEEMLKLPEPSSTLGKRIQQLKENLKEIEVQHGKISGMYWWARSTFDGKNPTFSMIDEKINDDLMLRILYKRACIAIHASSMGSMALLGRHNERGNIIYTTATDEGFEAPLLLGMVSHERVVDVICDYWKLEKKKIFKDADELYKLYAKNVFF